MKTRFELLKLKLLVSLFFRVRKFRQHVFRSWLEENSERMCVVEHLTESGDVEYIGVYTLGKEYPDGKYHPVCLLIPVYKSDKTCNSDVRFRYSTPAILGVVTTKHLITKTEEYDLAQHLLKRFKVYPVKLRQTFLTRYLGGSILGVLATNPMNLYPLDLRTLGKEVN